MPAAKPSVSVKIPEHRCVGLLGPFLNDILAYPEEYWLFRGQASIDWPLRPKAGRPEYFLEQTTNLKQQGLPPRDLGRFREWREKAVAYYSSLPENELECLAFAQHYGLATRLLDWSGNPLVALYFAVEKCSVCDGAVFCHAPSFVITAQCTTIEEIDDVVRYEPRPLDRRVLAQDGKFTYHPQPEAPLQASQWDKHGLICPDGTNLAVFRIKAEDKERLRDELARVGVSRKQLFPDLEGLSDYVNWQTARMAGVRKRMKQTNEQITPAARSGPRECRKGP